MRPSEGQWGEWERELLPRLGEFGISRLGDTAGLDSPGIPTASATRPGTADVIWVYSGKGLTQSQARVTAIMECLERTASLWPVDERWITETPRVLRRSHEVWMPDRFTYRRRDGVGDDDPQVWIEAVTLTGACRPVMVPADLCFNGRRPLGLAQSPYLLSTSNGLAAAFTLEDALEHGLAEVIERDVVSCAEVRASHLGYRFLAVAAARFGLSDAVLARFEDDVDQAVTLDRHSLPASGRGLVARFEAAGMDVVVKALSNDFDLPAFGVCAIQQADLTRILGCAGYAVRLSSAAALESALLELAQTRATDLQGAREDRNEPEKQRLDHAPERHWLATPGRAATAYEEKLIDGGLSALLDRCSMAGLADTAYVEFPGWPGVSVVRVVVPEAETWHATGGWSSVGPRLRALVGGV